MGLENEELVFGAADEFIAGYLIRRHQAASNRGAHAMLPPGYRFGATSPVPSPTYVYSIPGTGVPGQHPAIHSVHLAPLTKCLRQPGHFCLGEPPVSEWHFNDSPIPWVLPENYRDPNRPDPNSRAPLSMQTSTGGPVLGTSVQISDAVDAAGIRPEDAQEVAEDNEDDDFITVGDAEHPAGDPVIVSITGADVYRATGTGNSGGRPRLFESDDDESDAQAGPEVEALLVEGGPLDIPEVVDDEEALVEDGDHSSDDDDEDEDGDDANVTRDYYANQELPPKETPSEIPKQSALMDMLAGRKPR